MTHIHRLRYLRFLVVVWACAFALFYTLLSLPPQF